MTRARFFLAADQWQEGALVLTGDEAKHCAQVTRHRVGDEIIVFDGMGRRATTRIESMTRQQVDLSILSVVTQCDVGKPITLVQGITKGDAMEWIIEKAVELGVRRIIPMMSARSIVRLDAGEATKKRDKWQRLALEACKQCGQDWLTDVVAPSDLATAIKLCEGATLKFVASLHDQARPLRTLWNRDHDDGNPAVTGAAVAIGPEGDFTEDEYLAFHRAGFRAWSLGARTLRSETAAICALSILGYELAEDHLPI